MKTLKEKWLELEKDPGKNLESNSLEHDLSKNLDWKKLLKKESTFPKENFSNLEADQVMNQFETLAQALFSHQSFPFLYQLSQNKMSDAIPALVALTSVMKALPKHHVQGSYNIAKAQVAFQTANIGEVLFTLNDQNDLPEWINRWQSFWPSLKQNTTLIQDLTLTFEAGSTPVLRLKFHFDFSRLHKKPTGPTRGKITAREN